MGQVRHGSAMTTHAVRAAIQRSQASLAQLSRELSINPKTVAKWRKRATVEDMKTGPTEPRSTVLTEAEEAAIVAFGPVLSFVLEAICHSAMNRSPKRMANCVFASTHSRGVRFQFWAA